MKRILSKFTLPGILAFVILCAGIGVRLDWMQRTALWCDEAESSINALSIQETGVPASTYLGLPVYENTLTEPWEDHPEYEFRDSSYSSKGVTVYHGWLPLYAIAASQMLFGLHPDKAISPPRVQHSIDQVRYRTLVPRIPALGFAILCMVATYFVGRSLAGPAAGLAALTLMALNARTVDFGYQARYYSLTLLLTVVVTGLLISTVRKGRWRDFLALGLTEGLLFHTHQFSAVVFAGAAMVTVPSLLQHRNGFVKGIAAAAVTSSLILPWVWFSGFLETASGVPKVFKLFDGYGDWLAYSLDRPIPLALIGLLIVILILSYLRPLWLPASLCNQVRRHGRVYAFLLFWMMLGYVAFHVLVPAASFFVERLSLVLWTPFVLACSVFVADLLRKLPIRMAAIAAVVIMTLLLAVRGRLSWLEAPSIGTRPEGVIELISALDSTDFAADTRFYATPNDHLTYTYYTGIPIQSVAPVRPSFFHKHEGPIVFIERQMDPVYPALQDIEDVARRTGVALSNDQISEITLAIWTTLIAEDFQRRNLPQPEIPTTPIKSEELLEKTRARMMKFRTEYLTGIQSFPVLRSVPAETVKDVWMGFFYRFVEPEKRIGKNLSILPRLSNASVILLPDADAAILYSEHPPKRNED